MKWSRQIRLPQWAESSMAEFLLNGKRVWVAGETGLVGRAILRSLEKHDIHLLSAPHWSLDLTNQKETFDWIARNKPDAIFMAAAKVGGIGANAACPADFIRDNLAIAQNVIEGAHRADVTRLLFLGSSCIYPKHAPQPIKEEALLTGPLEETNEAYAIAKIAGLKMCEMYNRQYGTCYISVMPTNLYGPNDNFDLANSHVLPALIRKFHEAKVLGAPQAVVWGTGTPVREFLHVDDLASACLHLMQTYDGAQGIVNVGTGVGVTIAELAELIKNVVGYEGGLVFDATKPDGMPFKVNDNSRLKKMGWTPTISLHEGLERTYRWYIEEGLGK